MPLQTEVLPEVFVGLGANLGDARAAVVAAIAQIAALPQTQLLRRSSLYKTAPLNAPMGAGGGDYINAVISVATALAPLDLLRALQNLEQQAGRQRPYRNAPRTLDLDILLFGDLSLDSPELVVPHPRMWERAFVLLPLAEVAPERVSTQQLENTAGQVIEKIVD